MSRGEIFLSARDVAYTAHTYDFHKQGLSADSTLGRAAEQIDAPVTQLVKSLVVALGDGSFVFLLMAGGGGASMRALARTLGQRSAELADPRDAQRLTGYQVGGMSPLGSRQTLPVYLDLSVFEHDQIYINGGRRGLMLLVDPEALLDAVEGELVDVRR